MGAILRVTKVAELQWSMQRTRQAKNLRCKRDESNVKSSPRAISLVLLERGGAGLWGLEMKSWVVRPEVLLVLEYLHSGPPGVKPITACHEYSSAFKVAGHAHEVLPGCAR